MHRTPWPLLHHHNTTQNLFLTATFQNNSDMPIPEYHRCAFYWSKDDGGGVKTGAVRCAKLSNRHQQTNTQLFTGRMTFLSPNQNQQCHRACKAESIIFHRISYSKPPPQHNNHMGETIQQQQCIKPRNCYRPTGMESFQLPSAETSTYTCNYHRGKFFASTVKNLHNC